MIVLNLYYQLNIRKYAKVIHSHYKSLNQLDLFHSLLQDKLIEYDDLYIIKGKSEFTKWMNLIKKIIYYQIQWFNKDCSRNLLCFLILFNKDCIWKVYLNYSTKKPMTRTISIYFFFFSFFFFIEWRMNKIRTINTIL